MKIAPFLFSVILLVLTVRNYEAAECGINPTTCGPETLQYRTLDGTCNNLNHPGWGSAGKPYGRFYKPPNYSDGKSKKAVSASGDPLPNSRWISEVVAFDSPQMPSNKVRFLGAWHQFPAHDHSFTAFTSFPQCCTEDFKTMANTSANCDNMKIPEKDSFYSQFGATCMPKVKTATTWEIGCSNSPPEVHAEQISSVTSYFDLNQVYGQIKAVSDGLRTFEGGTMKVRNVSNAEYPPTGGIACAIPANNPNICYATGDVRANQNLDLVIKQIMWLRFHNWCCRIMAPINPHWDDEKMFQECRKINIGVYQYLTFHYAYAAVLGFENMKERNLVWPYNFPNTERAEYDDTCELKALNEFSTGAYRILHALLVACLKLGDEDRNRLGHIKMMDYIGNPGILEQNDNFDNLVRGGTWQEARQVGQSHDSHITTKFPNGLTSYNFGIDMIATDIDRSREHGIPSYNSIRKKCGLRTATTFDDLMEDMSPSSVDNLKKVYKNVSDIDYYVGAMSEKPAYGAIVGPAVKCVILEALEKIQRCDRFWYDNTENNFNTLQLASMRSNTIASFICLTGDSIKKMQLDALEPPSLLNPLVSCEFLKPMSLLPWKEHLLG